VAAREGAHELGESELSFRLMTTDAANWQAKEVDFPNT
jgi:hypothetical protein